MHEVIGRIKKFSEDRDWKQFHTPENLAKSIVLESAELLENFQWNNEYDDENIKDELADVMIYCLLLADTLSVDLKEVIHKKLDNNEKKYPIEKSRGSSKKYTNYNYNS